MLRFGQGQRGIGFGVRELPLHLSTLPLPRYHSENKLNKNVNQERQKIDVDLEKQDGGGVEVVETIRISYKTMSSATKYQIICKLD